MNGMLASLAGPWLRPNPRQFKDIKGLCSAKSRSGVDCAFWTCHVRLLLADLFFAVFLRITAPKLVISDGHQGLTKALEKWPGCRLQ